MRKQKHDRQMNKSELQTQTYYYQIKQGSNGKPNRVVRFNRNDPGISTFLQTAW